LPHSELGWPKIPFVRLFEDSLEPPPWATGAFVGDYFDPASGRLFLVARPPAQPQLWAAYIEGAWLSYRQHGVESAVDYEHVRDGNSTSLFVAAVEFDGRVVGGARVQGPYTDVEQAYALREWAGREGTDVLRRQIAQRLVDGVVEVKAVWVDNTVARHDELTTAMARIFVHAMTLSKVRYAFCTAASHAVPRWQSSGGVVSTDVAPVAYPDERYWTLPLWWDREHVYDSVSLEQRRAILQESSQLYQRSSSLWHSVA
jgi:hypothetical protein